MSEVADIAHELRATTQFIVRCNQSLSWRGNARFIVYAGILTLGIASIFAFQGLWLILPFAGLEIFALALGMYVCCLRSCHKEVITIKNERLIIEKGAKYPIESWEFDRAWLNLELKSATRKGYPSKLLIRSKSQQTEVGECLTNKERKSLANSLGAALNTRLIKS